MFLIKKRRSFTTQKANACSPWTPCYLKTTTKARMHFLKKENISKKKAGKDKYFGFIVDMECFFISFPPMHYRKLIVKFPMHLPEWSEEKSCGTLKNLC